MAMSELADKQTMEISESAERVPEEIIVDILTRLPAKSVGQFRCVSKQWCSLLSDPRFIKAHLAFHEQEVKLIFISNVSRSLHTITFNPNPQNAIEAISRKLNFQGLWGGVYGSCNGLILVSKEEDIIFLINPTTLEYRRIPNSPLALPKGNTSVTYALGYDIATDDYKVITLSYYQNVRDGDLFCTFVDVYSVRMGFWRRLESLSHHNAIPMHGFGFFVNGALHWLAEKYDGPPSAIVAFDLTDEKFFELPIPTILDNDHMLFYDFVALRGCLVLLATARGNKMDVWMMKEYGVAKSWTKFSIIVTNYGFAHAPVCLMSDDDIILDVPGREKFIIYNKKGKQRRAINVDGITVDYVRSRAFMESLVSPMIG